DQAMADVGYEAAADFYDRALQAMDIDDRPADDPERAEVLLARCEALLAAGDVGGATDAVTGLEEAAAGSPRLAAWATCFAGQLVLEAFRGRAHAARRMLESPRRTLAGLGLRHAIHEVDLFVGLVELVDADPSAAQAPLRRAFNGFRRMGVDSDAALAAALLA